jgi:predicted metal-dependent HD superfamily phosphohydrolase
VKDIEFLVSSKNKTEGSKKMIVAASATLIYPGDIVACTLGDENVALLATNKPTVATDFVRGIAVSTSTNTSAAAGTVQVVEVDPSDVLLIKPNVAATFDTQAEYDALVGSRVLLDLTSTKYTILAADSANYGCVIRPLDISKYPGKVAFSVRGLCNPDMTPVA